MTPEQLEKAARKLCELRGIDPDSLIKGTPIIQWTCFVTDIQAELERRKKADELQSAITHAQEAPTPAPISQDAESEAARADFESWAKGNHIPTETDAHGFYVNQLTIWLWQLWRYRQMIIKLKQVEIDFLRLYGNKDCTAMADEARRNHFISITPLGAED